MHDTLHAGAIEGDHGGGPQPVAGQEVLHATQVPGALLPHRRGKQHGSRRGNARLAQRLGHGDQRG